MSDKAIFELIGLSSGVALTVLGDAVCDDSEEGVDD